MAGIENGGTQTIIIAIDTLTDTKITIVIQHIIPATVTDTTDTGVLDPILSTVMGTTAEAAAAAEELGATVVNRRTLYDILITWSLFYKMHFQRWFC